MKLFIPLSKVDEEQRMVFGYASTYNLDNQGDIVSREAIEKALPDYMRFANIREMHQLSAVGITREAEIDEKGLYLAAHIVDDAAWNKVKAGVYKGFSIGGKLIKKVKNTITELRLSEISLVDRPANPEAVLEYWKADGAESVLQPEQNTMEKTTDQAATEGATAKADESQVTATTATEKVDENIAKRGARFSKRTKASLSAIHKMMRDCDKALADMGYEDAEESEDDNAMKADQVDAKPEPVAAEILDLAKAAGVELQEGALYGDIAKAAFAALEVVKSDLAKANDDLAKANDRIKALEAEPTPPKGAKAVVVEKADDKGGTTVEKKAEEAPKTPEEAIAKAHQRPQFFALSGGAAIQR